MNMQSLLENALITDIWLPNIQKSYMVLAIASSALILGIICLVEVILLAKTRSATFAVPFSIAMLPILLGCGMGLGIPALDEIKTVTTQAHEYSAKVLRFLSDPNVQAPAERSDSGIYLDLYLPPQTRETSVVLLGKTFSVKAENDQRTETLRVSSAVLDFLDKQGFRMASNASEAIMVAKQ